MVCLSFEYILEVIWQMSRNLFGPIWVAFLALNICESDQNYVDSAVLHISYSHLSLFHFTSEPSPQAPFQIIVPWLIVLFWGLWTISEAVSTFWVYVVSS